MAIPDEAAVETGFANFSRVDLAVFSAGTLRNGPIVKNDLQKYNERFRGF
jgi:hypothetical protein